MEKRNDRWASRTFCSSFHVKGALRLRTLFHFFFLSYEFFRRIQYSLEPVWKSISAICAPFCSIFYPNSVAVAHYGALILVKSPTNCDVHLAESFLNMLWKYRKNRKSIKHNKLLLQKQKNFGIILYNLEAFYSALKAYLYLYFN